jgi:hypothetical protein
MPVNDASNWVERSRVAFPWAKAGMLLIEPLELCP